MNGVIELDERIIEAIRAERAMYRCCSARQLARRLRMNHVYISKRLGVLKTKGVVGYTSNVIGSIHLIGSSEVEASAQQPIETPEATTPVSPDPVVVASVPSAPKVPAKVKPAVKKPAVKKVSAPAKRS